MSVLDYPSHPPIPTKTLIVALAGNPNSGKTTIFNGLTGLRQKVANYPGVTVEKKVGKTTLEDGQSAEVIDLPGTYSLISKSPDEEVAMQVLRGLRADTPAPDVVIAVVDASNLQRNLYFVSQLIELGRPLVIALNMSDVAARRGLHISAERLSSALGVPVVPVVGHKKQGIDELKNALKFASIAPMPQFALPEPMQEEIRKIAGVLSSAEPVASHDLVRAERLLVHDPAQDNVKYQNDPRIRPLLDRAHARLESLHIDPMQADIEAHYHWIDDVAARALEPACGVLEQGSEEGERRELANPNPEPRTPNTLPYAHPLTLSDKLDRIFLHKVWGLLTFAGIMACVFVGIFTVAAPIMEGTEALIGWLGDFVTARLSPGALHDLWSEGIVAGVGGVLVFVPQIAVLFLFIAILEDSGYLARAAFLMDRVLGKIGLNGKSFIPLLSSFACAIPGIMATRTIENRQDRLATIFVAPFMSCSARLPVYGLLIGAFFASFSPAARGGIMFLCYALGCLAAVLTALLFRKTFMKSARTSFVLELPTYKVPQITQVIRVVLTNTWMFVRRAGTIIFCLSVILWAMQYYPRLDPAQEVAIRTAINDEIATERAEVDALVARAKTDLNARSELRSHLNLLPGNEGGLSGKWRHMSFASIEGSPYGAHFNAEFGFAAPEPIADEAVKAAQLRQSISGRIGHFIEPVIRPLGYDWKMGVGLIASFAAREVFVSQMNIVYAAGGDEENVAPLEEAMLADTYASGAKVWTTPVAISLLVWFVLAMQCMSTVAIVRRETGTWTWPIAQLAYMNALAYVCALIAYQVTSALIG